MPTYSPQSLGITAPSGGFLEGGFYGGREYRQGTLSEPGQLHPLSDRPGAGQSISPEVISQTNPSNVDFINQQISANQIQAPVSIPYSTGAQNDYISGLTSTVDTARKAVDEVLAARKTEIDTKMASLREKEQQTLDTIGTLTTPFREELENTERERLYINENFESNQALVNELDQLLTEGNELIRQQQEVTGLAAVRNPRIQKTIDDVAARAGVIEAVINARNGQIAQAETMIDRSVRAIEADRKDQIAYYETILELNNRDIISLDEDSKKVAQEQLDLKKFDLENATETANYVKQLLVNPQTAGLMGEAGVKLNDSIETINAKLANAEYSREVRDLNNTMALEGGQQVISTAGVPKDELVTLTDSRGNKYTYRVKKTASTGTAAERSVREVSTAISTSNMTFDEIVQTYANQLTLAEIYAAYNQSEMGKNFGPPKEPPNEIALLYKVARGEMTPSEARGALEG